MANDFSAVQAQLFSAARAISREDIGLVGSVDQDWDDKGVAKGDSVDVSVYDAATTGDYTPSMALQDGDDSTARVVSFQLNQEKKSTFALTVEQDRALMNGGAGDNLKEFFRQKTEQAVRAVANGIESYLNGVVYKGASRAVGTAGTTPFASDFKILNSLRKILDDNGAPKIDRGLVIGSDAALNLRNLGVLHQVNTSGSDATLRMGELLPLSGFRIAESAGVPLHTKGTGAGYLVDLAAGYAIGERTMHVDTGTGTILAGDVITHASDATNKYIVNSGFAGDGDGDITIGDPGLRIATADDDALTIGNGYTANVGLVKQAAKLVVRPGLQTDNPAIMTQVITDEVSGMSMLFERLLGDGKTAYRVRAVYDAFVVNPDHIAVLMG